MTEKEQPDSMEAGLRALAAQADTEGWDGDHVADQGEAAAPQEEVKPEGSVSPEAPEVTQSQDPSPQAPEETQKDLDYRSEYEKLKRDYERQDRSWKRLNEEKEALAKVKATVRPDETRIAGDQFSAEEYEAYAEKTIEEGGPDAVKIARQAVTKAKQIRQQAFQESWQSDIKAAIDEEPELGNQESELAKTVNEILRDKNWGRFKTAVQLAKAKKLEASVPGLMGEIELHKKEIERLTKAMEVGGKPGLNKRDQPKGFEDMLNSDLKGAGEYLRRRAAEADEHAY